MKILVTGGAGFVGRHFVKRLSKDAEQIVVVDNLLSGGGGIPPSRWDFVSSSVVRFVESDCRSYFDSSSEYFDLVIHLAAVVGGRLTIERNPLAIADDLSIDASFWKWAVKNKPGHIISFSSSAAYPVNLQNSTPRKLKEEDIAFDSIIGMPDLTYGWAKLTNEYIGLIAAKTANLKVASYRPFSGYGPDQSLDYPFPSICLRAIENIGAKVFEVWGSGLQERDFIHIDDLVDAVITTYPKITDGSSINLCSGVGTSFLNLAKNACNLMGYDPIVKGKTDMPEGVFSRIGDPTKLNNYGWSPKIDLNQGIMECIEFLKRERI